MITDFDIVIVGAGFGGSLLSLVARRLGKRVLLVERGKHPRFAVGESTSPLSNLLLEQIALRYDLPRLLPLTAFGPWQRTYPQLGCGLKRGFTFFHHEANQAYRAGPERSSQLLVAASPNNEVADTHWLRADVDEFLVHEAAALGVEYLDETSLTGIEWAGSEGVASLVGERRGGQAVRARTRLVIDATGPRGFLARALALPESSFANCPPTQALFSHFTGVLRCEDLDPFRPEETPPYPLDDAALHHVFDGGWMWVLRFGSGVTSAGIALTQRLAEEIRLSEGEPAWGRFLSRFPSIHEQFAHAQAIRAFVYSPQLAYRCSRAAGADWALLPSAAAFIDPLFSTGIPLTLLGVQRLGRILEETDGGRDMPARLDAYGTVTLAEADWTAYLIGACYPSFARFPLFAALSMFYFAAASFSEIAHRLDRPRLAGRYLAQDHAVFAAGLRRCADLLHAGTASRTGWSQAEVDSFGRQVAEAVFPLNIAGLCDAAKRNWYNVDLEDVVRGAGKLGLTPLQMRRIVRSAPWAQGALQSRDLTPPG